VYYSSLPGTLGFHPATLISICTAVSCAWGLLEVCWRVEEGSRRLGVARVDRISLPRLPPLPEASGGGGCRV